MSYDLATQTSTPTGLDGQPIASIGIAADAPTLAFTASPSPSGPNASIPIKLASNGAQSSTVATIATDPSEIRTYAGAWLFYPVRGQAGAGNEIHAMGTTNGSTVWERTLIRQALGRPVPTSLQVVNPSVFAWVEGGEAWATLDGQTAFRALAQSGHTIAIQQASGAGAVTMLSSVPNPASTSGEFMLIGKVVAP